MELKLKKVFGISGERVFKSHLYGIEIRHTARRTESVKRLNRTFMELKSYGEEKRQKKVEV